MNNEWIKRVLLFFAWLIEERVSYKCNWDHFTLFHCCAASIGYLGSSMWNFKQKHYSDESRAAPESISFTNVWIQIFYLFPVGLPNPQMCEDGLILLLQPLKHGIALKPALIHFFKGQHSKLLIQEWHIMCRVVLAHFTVFTSYLQNPQFL